MDSLNVRLRVSATETPHLHRLQPLLPRDPVLRALVLASWIQRGIDRLNSGTLTITSADNQRSTSPKAPKGNLSVTLHAASGARVLEWLTANPQYNTPRWIRCLLEIGAADVKHDLYLAPLAQVPPAPEPETQATAVVTQPASHHLPANQVVVVETYPENELIDAADLASVFAR